MRKGLLIGLFTLLITGCGFHLRGMVQTPVWLTKLAISDANYEDAELIAKLRAQLKSNHVEIQSDLAQAPYWLIINNSAFSQRIISIGASTNPRQYQLLYTLEFLLQTKSGEIILPKRKIIISRQLTINNDRILSSNDEEGIIMNEMRQNALIQLMSQLFTATPISHAN